MLASRGDRNAIRVHGQLQGVLRNAATPEADHFPCRREQYRKELIPKLLCMLSRPQFWFSPEYTLQAEAELGSFSDIVSAWAADKSYFRVGVLSTQLDRKRNDRSCASFTVHTFTHRNGTPRVFAFHPVYQRSILTKLLFHQKHTKYKITSVKNTFKTEEDITRLFLDVVRSDLDDKSGFSLFPITFLRTSHSHCRR